MKRKADYSYNERLFSSGMRKQLHTARFHWLAESLKKLPCQYASVLELGCFDGKVIDYLSRKPTRYLGLDANWEGGLDIARERWKNEQNFEFRECYKAEDMQISGEQFDIAVCMDTLEHISPEMVEPYLHELSKVTKQYIFVSVPNEKGIVFFCKYLVKRILGGDTKDYTTHEFVNATFGRMDKVIRKEHKGFDYDALIKSISQYFEIYDISGYPFAFLPVYFNFGVGIIGKTRIY